MRIAEITQGLTPTQLVALPEPDAWSARDVLAHLRACSDMWGKYMVLILSEDKPTFKAVNPRTWIKETNYLAEPFQPSFEAFSDQRSRLLATLSPLAPTDWDRTGTATGSGKPRVRTVHTYALWLANHEGSHFKQLMQIARTVRL